MGRPASALQPLSVPAHAEWYQNPPILAPPKVAWRA